MEAFLLPALGLSFDAFLDTLLIISSLNPESIRLQCSQAVSRMEEDNKALEIINQSIQEF